MDLESNSFDWTTATDAELMAALDYVDRRIEAVRSVRLRISSEIDRRAREAAERFTNRNEG